MFVLAFTLWLYWVTLVSVPRPAGQLRTQSKVASICLPRSALLSPKDNLASRTSINTASSGCSLRERLGQRRTRRLASWRWVKPSGSMTGDLRTQSQEGRGQAATHETCVPTPEGLWPAQSPPQACRKQPQLLPSLGAGGCGFIPYRTSSSTSCMFLAVPKGHCQLPEWSLGRTGA